MILLPLQQPGYSCANRESNEFDKLKNNPSLMPMAIDETIRWVTPVKNFFRTPIEDCIIGDKEIKKDESNNASLSLWKQR